MGLVDGVAATFIMHDAEGRTLVRPFGRRGRTYLVPPDREEDVQGFIQLGYLPLLAAVLVAEQVFGLVAALAVVPLLTAALLYALDRRLREFPVTDAKPVETRTDMQVVLARSLGTRRVAITLAIAVMFTAGGVWMGLSGERDGWWIAAFFGVGAAMQLRTLRLLRRAGPPQG
jgi:hypothetical protein